MARPKLPRDAAGNIIRHVHGETDGRAELADAQTGPTGTPISDEGSDAVEYTDAGAMDAPSRKLTGLVEALPIAARASRIGKPHGTEAAMDSLALRLGEIRTMLPDIIAHADGDVLTQLRFLAALL